MTAAIRHSTLDMRHSTPVLVTGAAGMVGSHLVERLARRGTPVVAVDNFNDYYAPAQKRANVAGFADLKGVTLVEADIRDAAKMTELFATHKPRAVAHLAAMANVRYSIGRAPLYTDVNVVGSVNLLEAARLHGTQVFAFASTSSIYGHTKRLPFIEDDACNEPLSAYPATKKAIELIGYTYHNLHGLNFTALRFFSVYGPRARPDMMPFMTTDCIVKGKRFELFDAGQMKRDWTYVDDIAAGVEAALDRPLGYQVINLGRGEPVLMADFVTIVEKLVGRKAVLDTPPAPPSELKVNFANIDKARTLLGYHPTTDVETGMARLWDWYRKQYQ